MLSKLVILVCFCSLVSSQSSPVFLWGSSSSPFKPALKSLSSDDFLDIISPNLKDSMLLVFLEENLQTQDFSQCKLESGETCFSNLKQYKIKTFYADVEEPVQSIKSFTNDDKIVILKIARDGKIPEIDYEVGKTVLISFEEKTEERSQALIEHDSIMAEIYNMIENQGKVLAVYTSQQNSHRVRRQAQDNKKREESNNGKFLINNVNNTYVTINIKNIKIDNKEIDLTTSILKLEQPNGSPNIDGALSMPGGDLKFVVAKQSGYWYVHNMTLGDDLFRSSIEAPVGFSYFCGNLTYRSEKGKQLDFNRFQIETHYNVTDGNKLYFHDAYHCVGFINVGIISGLFVSFMLLIIISIGITWLMDIRTMDRFDDPKGKTITINVTD